MLGAPILFHFTKKTQYFFEIFFAFDTIDEANAQHLASRDARKFAGADDEQANAARAARASRQQCFLREQLGVKAEADEKANPRAGWAKAKKQPQPKHRRKPAHRRDSAKPRKST